MFQKMSIVSEITKNFLYWMLGDFDGKLCALFAFIALNCVTRFFAYVCVDKSLRLNFKWFLNKMMIFIIVAMANIIDTQILENGDNIRTYIILFFLATEGYLILNVLERFDILIPKNFKELLKKWSEKDDIDDNINHKT